jgi:hypothetical protein
MKMQEINAKAKQLGINPFGKTKASLIREIQKAEGNFDCFGTANGHCDQLMCCFRTLCIPENKPQRNSRTKASARQ